MSENRKAHIEQVLPIAQEIGGKLSMYCDRIEIAGSIRRGRQMIGDIELVALPMMEETKNLLGEVVSSHSKLDYFFKKRKVNMIKNGTKYKQFKYAGYTVDLFIPESPAHWGCIFLIRTGSSDFSKWLMTDAQRRAGLRFKDGRLTRQGLPLDTPEESDALDALGLPWIPPNQRDDGLWLDYVLKEKENAKASII